MLELLVYCLSQVLAGRSCIFPSLALDLQGFEVSIADILVAKLWSACEASSQRHTEVLLMYSVIFHLDNMTKPVNSSLL